jgi:hypothetical protein
MRRGIAKSFAAVGRALRRAAKVAAKRPACTERRFIFGRMARWWQRSRDEVESVER